MWVVITGIVNVSKKNSPNFPVTKVLVIAQLPQIFIRWSYNWDCNFLWFFWIIRSVKKDIRWSYFLCFDLLQSNVRFHVNTRNLKYNDINQSLYFHNSKLCNTLKHGGTFSESLFKKWPSKYHVKIIGGSKKKSPDLNRIKINDRSNCFSCPYLLA